MNRASLIAVCALLPGALAAQFPTTPPPAAPLRELGFPPFQEARLANGLDVLVVENRELPVVSISLSMPAGAAYDPTGFAGLASFVSELLTKGTAKRTADQIAESIEGVGGSLVAFPDNDFMTVTSTVLTDHVPLVFELIADVLLNSTYPESELELARTRTLTGLQAARANPSALAEEQFAKALYGSHPYGRSPTEASTRAITRDAVRRFASERLKPQGSLLVIAGDMDLAAARRLVEQHLSAWTGAAPAVTFARPPAASATRITLVHRPGSAQSNILIGNLTARPGDPAYYAATIANRVLGGGSDARLFNVLREKKSWTYGAYSSISRPKDIGSFRANAEVRTAVTDSALNEMLSLIRSVRTTAPADSEMTASKGQLVGSFPRQIETPQQIAGQVSSAKLLGLGNDYLRTYRQRLSAVTNEDARRAALGLMRPDSSVIVVVGDGEALHAKLSAIAPVQMVDTDGKPVTEADLKPKVAPLKVDPTQIVARRDSFQILVQGSPFGSQVNELRNVGDTLVYSEQRSLGGLSQAATVKLAAGTFALRSVDAGMRFGAQSIATQVALTNGRIKGQGQSSQGGPPETVQIDTTLAEGTIESNALILLLPGLPFAEGASIPVSTFDASNGRFTVLTLKVEGVENVTVPAGTFSAFRVDVTGGQAVIRTWVSRETPRRVIKMEIVGQPVSFVLVK